MLNLLMLMQATDELRERLGKLKAMYGSGIKTLDGIAGELDGNSQSTFGDLNSEVSNHSHALEDVSNTLTCPFEETFSIILLPLTLNCVDSALQRNCFGS